MNVLSEYRRRLGLAAGLAALCAVASAQADPVDPPADLEPMAQRSLLLDVARAGTRLVAVGERGHVLLSDDNGKSWAQAAAVPSRTMLTGVCFADANRGWAVGHDEIILATLDGGRTWRRDHYAPETQQPLLDILCIDAQHAIAVGAYGSYFATDDGGTHWNAQKFVHQPLQPPAKTAASADEDVPPDYHLNRIAAAGPYLFIAAEAGQIYRSADRGATWISLPSPYNGSLFGLLPLQDGALLVFGLRGNLFITRDAGVSWSRIAVGTSSMLTDGLQLKDGTIVVVGLSGALVVSRDGGATFTLEEQADRKGLSAALATGAEQIVAVGESGARQVDVKCGCTAPMVAPGAAAQRTGAGAVK